MRVDLPAPLWPTRPMHSPAGTAKSTPFNARTAPKDFSTPSKLTIVVFATPIDGPTRDARAARARAERSLHVGLDRRDGVFFCIFVARDAASLNLRQFRFEIVLGA